MLIKLGYWIVFFVIVVLPARVMGQAMQVYKDGEHTVRVWNLGYDKNYKSDIYSDAPNGFGARQLLTGKLSIQFQNPSVAIRASLAQQYQLSEIGKHSVGDGIYVYKYSGDNKLLINISYKIIIENTGKVKAAYPDWILLGVYK